MRTIRPADESAVRAIRPADETAVRATRPADDGALPTIRLAVILGMPATAALLGVVSATAGLGVAGWIAGLATGAAATMLIATARIRSDQPAMHPADWVTLTRAVLCAGVAGLVADSFGRPVPVTALVTLAAVALALDAVDGQVARRTGTATPLGGRLDGEVDAFLILLLSIAVSQRYGELGAGHRRRPLRAAAGGLADSLAGRAIAAPVLAQGRGRGPGHRAHRRRVGPARPPRRDDRGRCRAAAAGRVVRPRRDLAVPHRRRPAHPPRTAAGRHRACGRARVG